MAKFKRGNLDLNTNQKIRLGDSLDSEIQYDGSSLLVDGPVVELLHNGTKVIETTATGIKIGDGTDVVDFEMTVGNFEIKNTNLGGIFQLKATRVGGAETAIFWADPDSNTIVYDGPSSNPALTTSSVGVKVTGTGGEASLRWDTNVFNIKSHNHGGGIGITAEDTGGVERQLFFGDGDGATELYYAGNKTLETINGGIKINGEIDITSDTTGIVVVGDIHCDDLYVSGDTIFVGTGQIGSVSGSIDLYHQGTKVFNTFQSSTLYGFEVTDGSDIGRMYISNGDFYIHAQSNQQSVVLSGKDGVGADKNMLLAIPHQGVTLNYNGISAFATTSLGCEIRESGGDMGALYWSGSAFTLYNSEVSGTINIDGEDSVSALTRMATFDPDGAVDLYYAGTKEVSTKSGGMLVGSSLGVNGQLDITVGAATIFFDGTEESQGMRLRSTKAAGGLNTMFYGHPDNTAALYYNGAAKMQTAVDGISVTGNIGMATDGAEIKNSAGEEAIILNANGSVELYYDNVKKFETDSTGIVVVGSVRANDLIVDGDTIFLGNAELSSPSNDLILTLSGTEILNVDANTQTYGDTSRDHIIMSSNSLKFYAAGNNQRLQLGTNSQELGTPSDTFLNVNGSNNTIQGALSGGANRLYLSTTISRIGHADQPNVTVTQPSGVAINATNGELGFQTLANGATELYYNNSKTFETTADGALVTGDLQVTGDLVLDSTSAITASEIQYDIVGDPTYRSVQDGLDQLQSAGVISGGTISEDTTASISITAGTGLIRTSNSEVAPIVFIDWSGTSIHLPEDVDKTIVVKYNSGSSAVFAEDPASVNLNNMIVLGEVETMSGQLFFSNIRQRAGDFKARLLARMYDSGAVVRANHVGLILGESGDTNRYVTMTAGDVWALLELDSISAIDTETGDEFTEYWDDGAGGWNTSPGQTQWPIDDYDDLSGNLQPLSNNRYGNRWFYLIPSDNSLHMVYGVANAKSLAEAEAEPSPTDIPVILREHSVLIGRIIILKNIGIAAEVQTAFETTFNFSATTDHNNLTNLAVGDVHTQYAALAGTRPFTGTIGGVTPVADADLTTKAYVDGRLGEVVHVSSNYTASDGDIVIVDATAEVTVTLTESSNAKITVKTMNEHAVIQGASGLIDDKDEVELSDKYWSMTLVSDGTDWFII